MLKLFASVMGCTCTKKDGVSAFDPSKGSGGKAPKPSKEIVEKKVFQAYRTGVLALRECGLSNVPPIATAPEASVFRSVDVSSNQLVSLPDSMSSWSGLQKLSCQQNRLKELPSGIAHLVLLEKLLLSENRLWTLPSELSALSKLKSLQLDGNQLGPLLPDCFCGGLADSLEELDISRNKLQMVPYSFSSLQSLARLNVAQNEFKFLPEFLGELVKLQELDAADNKLSTVPPQLMEDTCISKLWLKGNPIDPLVLREVPGYNAFLERRKMRIDAKIGSNVVGEVNLSVCGLD